jgi:drug/metabolite transporter (DMT)-like permease
MKASSGTRIDWVLFLVLGFLWGSSYLFIKIGVEAGLPPFSLVMFRLLIGFVLLAAVVAVAREPLPRDARTYAHLFVMGAVNIAIPFSLITWAEQSVDSTLAAILNGAVPLFVIVLAALFLPNERITPARLVGLAIGFVGVAVLVGFDPADLQSGDLVAELALIGATLSYAAGGVYSKRNIHGLRPMIPAVFQVAFGLLIMTVLAFAFERPLELSVSPEALFAVVWLGLLGSGVAYLLFFRILERWGATRTSLVAYLLPVYGIVLGAAVLGEAVDARLIIGAVLIISGIALVNSRYGSTALFGRGRRATAG